MPDWDVRFLAAYHHPEITVRIPGSKIILRPDKMYFLLTKEIFLISRENIVFKLFYELHIWSKSQSIIDFRIHS